MKSAVYLSNFVLSICFFCLQKIQQNCSRKPQCEPSPPLYLSPSLSLSVCVEDKVFLLVIYFCFVPSTDSWFAVGVLGLLPSRTKFVGLWMHQILTFFGSCISDISFKIHHQTKCASLGNEPKYSYKVLILVYQEHYFHKVPILMYQSN